jgi:hypothetical protein
VSMRLLLLVALPVKVSCTGGLTSSPRASTLSFNVRRYTVGQ